MWVEYPILTDSDKQLKIAKQLRRWVQTLERRNMIKGYAFDFYSGKGRTEYLGLRLDYVDEGSKLEVEEELPKKLTKFNIEMPEPRGWAETVPEVVRRAYEFGSRCAYLFLELVERGRFQEVYTSSSIHRFNENHLGINEVPFLFQWHFNHGVMNSLGISKYPNEAIVHFLHLIDATDAKKPEQLCDWIQTTWAKLPLQEKPDSSD